MLIKKASLALLRYDRSMTAAKTGRYLSAVTANGSADSVLIARDSLESRSRRNRNRPAVPRRSHLILPFITSFCNCRYLVLSIILSRTRAHLSLFLSLFLSLMPRDKSLPAPWLLRIIHRQETPRSITRRALATSPSPSPLKAFGEKKRAFWRTRSEAARTNVPPWTERKDERGEGWNRVCRENGAVHCI